MKVLAIDVGIQITGFVIADVKNLNIELIKEGQIKPRPKQSLPEKLGYIFQELESQVKQFAPEAILAEKLYSHYRHPTTLGILAHVTGVVALLAQQQGLGFYEFAPTRARKSFTGKGNVNSLQVKKMAENLTGRKFKSTHTADAYSLVGAFSHMQKVKRIEKEVTKINDFTH